MRIKNRKLKSSKADCIMKFIMPQTQQSSQINVNFFLQTNGWISYISKSHFRSVERFWTHLHIVNNEASHHGLCGHQPCSQGFFPNAAQLMAFFSNQLLCISKEAHWQQGWVGMHHCWVFKLSKNKQFSYS